ncbi:MULTISPECIES: rod shape-determining protein MreC [unclassified Psychrobacter]|uniref:rod shape-determining protein MreC n=1 Tax=unclassified Psychrobacter TaxID=196806 RepID=UPI0018F66721|nr:MULTISPECIES: rod shape-determining protein MreC [unclassified Psychrobacter]
MMRQTPLPIKRAVLLLMAAGILLWIDTVKPAWFAPSYQHINTQVHNALQPVQRWALLPHYVSDWLGDMTQSKASLHRDNAKLRAQLLTTEAKLQQQNQILSDNTQLKALLGIQQPAISRLQITTIIGADPSVQQPILLLDKGSQQGVRVGQSVIDAHGLLGQIVHTTANTSQLLLLTASNQSVAVQVARTNQRAIVTGTGLPNELALSYMLKSADIRVGDTLISSGLGGRIAAGYQVGRVSHVERDDSARFLQIRVTPAAMMDTGRYALIVQPNELNINELGANEPNLPPTANVTDADIS